MSDSYGDKSVTPPSSQYGANVKAWCAEAITEGEVFLKSQPGYSKVDDTIRGIMSVEEDGSVVPGPLSKTTVNQFAKVALDLRSGLTDTKIFWEYRTNNRRFEKSGEVATKAARAWWLNSQADMRFADGISWCFAAGSAAMRLVYNRTTGMQELQAWDPRDVLPVRPNDLLDYDSAFAVVLRKENTVNYLRALYPNKAELIQPDRDGTSVRLGNGLLDKFASVASPILKGLFKERSKTQLKVPSCDTWTIQVKDDSTNETGQTVLMGPHGKDGRPQAPWCYAVEPGEALYPRGRVIVMTQNTPVPLYDGPNIYLHGRFDVTKLTLDQWPFSWLGKSPMWDVLPLQQSLRDAVRLVDNHIRKLQRPPVIADKNNVSRALWEKIDTAMPGMKVLQNPSMGKGIQMPIVPPLDPSVTWYVNFLLERIEYLSGAKDITNFAKLNQVPASETIEKMMEAMSPAIRSRSRTMEAFLRPLAYMWLGNFMEFDSMPKRIRALGPDGAVLEDFDFDPGTMVPAYVHAEDFDKSGVVTPQALSRGPRPRMERALEFLPQFDFWIAPGSLLKASEVSDKLLYLQLARAGMIDMWSLMERLGVQNVGAPPDGANTITERLVAQQNIGIGMAANSAGRKASGQEMPQMRGGKITES